VCARERETSSSLVPTLWKTLFSLLIHSFSQSVSQSVNPATLGCTLHTLHTMHTAHCTHCLPAPPVVFRLLSPLVSRLLSPPSSFSIPSILPSSHPSQVCRAKSLSEPLPRTPLYFLITPRDPILLSHWIRTSGQPLYINQPQPNTASTRNSISLRHPRCHQTSALPCNQPDTDITVIYRRIIKGNACRENLISNQSRRGSHRFSGLCVLERAPDSSRPTPVQAPW